MDSLAGALLMHVGMHELQNEFFAQRQPLTKVKKEAIYHHPEKSAKILKLAGLSKQHRLNIILQHRERT
ncbi:MAG TPA: hypothetical protein EYQ47_02480 [Cycloclasticus sp.]|jgi:HD-GYP domain-containing protein (c-di-GMP phosphodiesterase class II)|nr:hypothetical protein [Cycloclasticus sp.]